MSVRTLSLPILGLLTVVTLSGCSLLSPAPAAAPTAPIASDSSAPAAASADLADTTWSGTDSADLPTTFVLHEDGSTDITYGANSYTDKGDTWALDGDTLTITIHNVESRGDASYVGKVVSAKDPIDLAVSFTAAEEKRTLTITQ